MMSDCLGRTRAFYLLKHLTEGAGDFLKNCNMTEKDSPPFTQLCPFGRGARGPLLSPPWDGGPLELAGLPCLAAVPHSPKCFKEGFWATGLKM